MAKMLDPTRWRSLPQRLNSLGRNRSKVRTGMSGALSLAGIPAAKPKRATTPSSRCRSSSSRAPSSGSDGTNSATASRCELSVPVLPRPQQSKVLPSEFPEIKIDHEQRSVPPPAVASDAYPPRCMGCRASTGLTERGVGIWRNLKRDWLA